MKNKTIVIGLGLFSLVLGLITFSSARTEPVTTVNVNKYEPNILPSLNYDGKTTTIKVERLKVDLSRSVYIDGEIESYNSALVVRQLKELDKSNKPVYLFINSPGGNVFSGALVISQIEGMQAPVTTICTQLCASMAAMIHQYGHTRAMVDRAVLMFHPAAGGLRGQVPNMNSMLQMIIRYTNKMNQYIIARSGIKPELFNQLVAYEIWVESDDALAKKLTDKIVTTDVPVEPNGIDLRQVWRPWKL